MPPSDVPGRVITVAVLMRSFLDAEAYAARIDEEVGFRAAPLRELVGSPDVCLTDLRELPESSTNGDRATAPVVRLVGVDEDTACNGCWWFSKSDSWDELLGTLATAAGVERLNRGNDATELASLTRRELEVLRLVGRGKTVPEAAAELGIAPSTVGNHKHRLMRKLAATNSLQLLRIAVRNRLVTFD